MTKTAVCVIFIYIIYHKENDDNENERSATVRSFGTYDDLNSLHILCSEIASTTPQNVESTAAVEETTLYEPDDLDEKYELNEVITMYIWSDHRMREFYAEDSGDNIDSAIYNRNLRVEDRLGIIIEFVEEKGSVLIGYEKSGSNGVYTNSHLGKMHRKPLGKVGDGRLCRAVCGNLGQGTESVHGGNIQNAASFFSDHIRNKYLRGEKSTQEV